MQTDPSGGTVFTGGARSVISVGASPFTRTNPLTQAEVVVVSGGTVTTIEVSRDNVTFDVVGLVAGTFFLRPQDRIRVTYAVLPTMISYPV